MTNKNLVMILINSPFHQSANEIFYPYPKDKDELTDVWFKVEEYFSKEHIFFWD